jgi:hypothetical protein
MTIENPRRGGLVGICLIFGQGSGVTPDSGEAVLRSRLRPNCRQLPTACGDASLRRLPKSSTYKIQRPGIVGRR